MRLVRNNQRVNAESKDNLPSVFVYSGYRASSTWFWTKLRSNADLCCYYEIFNEGLASLTAATLAAVKPSDWRSRHPDTAPYFLEYSALVSNQAGVRGFPREEEVGCRYIGVAGIKGPLDADVAAYVDLLIESARRQKRLPVLTGTRMLARSGGLRQAFGGVHILLIRNLFTQWCSYSGQQRHGNDYFNQMLFATTRFRDMDPYIDYLCSFFLQDDLGSFSSWYRDGKSGLLFCYFAALHIYLFLQVRRDCDLTIDTNRLAHDKHYRRLKEFEIFKLIGFEVDLSDAKHTIDYPLFSADEISAHLEPLSGMIAKALEILHASDEEKCFALALLDDIRKEFERFSIYTRQAAALLTSATSELEKASTQIKTWERIFGETQAQLSSVRVELAAVELHNVRLAEEARRKAADLETALTLLDDLRTSLSSKIIEISAMSAELEATRADHDRPAET